MAEQHQSIKVVLDNIMQHPLLQDVTLETVINHTVNFMRLVGSPTIFEEKPEVIDIKRYRAKLPCDYHQVVQMRMVKNGEVGDPFGSSTDNFHMSDVKQGSPDNSYRIQGGIIHTNVEEGQLEIIYRAIALDDDGYPAIPDNSSFTRALELYIKRHHFTILHDLGKLSPQILNQTLQDYAWAVGDCQSEFNRLSLDEAESFYNSWGTLLPRTNQHKQGFANSGTRQKLTFD